MASPPIGGKLELVAEAPSRRFDSWKEIAAHFGRDVRTVRRWEHEEALPVHRHLHRSRASVYAYQCELDEWQARRAIPQAPTPAGASWPGFLVVLAFLAALGLVAWGFVQVNRAPTPPVSADPHYGTTAHGIEARARDWLADRETFEGFKLARHYLSRRVGFRGEARMYLEAAVASAPDFADAHALLGEAYLREALSDHGRGSETWPKAEASVRRALELDNSLAAAHSVLARILLFRDWNITDATASSRRAIELDSDAPEARSVYAACLRASGRVAEAIVERECAHRAEPLNPQWLVFLGDEYQFARRFVDAIRMYERALQVERDYRPAVSSLVDVYPRVGRYADAARWQWRWLILRGEKDLAAAFDDVNQREGPQAAMSWMDRWNLNEFRRAPDKHAWDLAYTHARLGDREAAVRFLERAYDLHDPGMLQARVDPDLDRLRDHPRFTDLLRRLDARGAKSVRASSGGR